MACGLAAAGCILPGLVWAAPAERESAQEKFYRAYYLEQQQSDSAAAEKLYREIVDDRAADEKLRTEARTRLTAIQEEQATTDFARLMPPDAWAYLEINRPGERLLKLIKQLGLLSDENAVAAEGSQRFAISPVLIRETLGIRGAALAVTGFDFTTQTPSGVLVFHPGNVEVIRGLIETGLPVAAQAVKPIEGYPTYEIEGKVTVTLAPKLVIASTQRPQIVSVLRRLKGEDTNSLANSEALAEALKSRTDAVLFFAINAKQVMPLVNGAIGVAGAQNRDAALAQAVLDLNSLRALTGRIGIGEDGLAIDLAVRMDKGHHSLVFNLLRTPPIDRQTLKCVPAGAAGFLAAALNEPASRYREKSAETNDTVAVTGLDVGREIFANIVSFAVFALPPSESADRGPLPIPDVAAVITVNDPAKTKALWTQALGLASLASGAAVVEGQPTEIEGTTVRLYQFEGGVTVYLATIGNDALISPSRAAIARAIVAKRSSQSILTDAAFGTSLARLRPESNVGLFVHAGRAVAIARQFMSPRDAQQAEPFLNVLTDTVASLVISHGEEEFRLSASITGIPNISGLVSQMILEQSQRGRRHIPPRRPPGHAAGTSFREHGPATTKTEADR
jgi:hypothetical protein